MDASPVARPSAPSDAEAGMPRRSTQRDPIRTPGSNFEENRALCGPVHVARILGTPPDEPKPESEPDNKTALRDEVTRQCRSSSPQQGVRSIHQDEGVAEEVAGGDAAAPEPLDAAADLLGTELTKVLPDGGGVAAPPDPVASPARSRMSKIPAAPGSSAKPARTPLRQSPGSKLPTPRRKDAPYDVEDKVAQASASWMALRGPLTEPDRAQGCPGLQSVSANQPLGPRWQAISALFLTSRTRPARPSGVSAAGDALVRILDRARPLALVLRAGGALQAALSTRRRASTLGPNERRVTSQSSELWRRTPQRARRPGPHRASTFI